MPLAQKVKSYIQDANDFLKKKANPRPLSDELLCTIDVKGLYPDIPHKDGLIAISKALDTRKDQKISKDSLIQLVAECFLKDNYLPLSKKLQ